MIDKVGNDANTIKATIKISKQLLVNFIRRQALLKCTIVKIYYDSIDNNNNNNNNNK